MKLVNQKSNILLFREKFQPNFSYFLLSLPTASFQRSEKTRQVIPGSIPNLQLITWSLLILILQKPYYFKSLNPCSLHGSAKCILSHENNDNRIPRILESRNVSENIKQAKKSILSLRGKVFNNRSTDDFSFAYFNYYNNIDH